jgi:hypothetical protein
VRALAFGGIGEVISRLFKRDAAGLEERDGSELQRVVGATVQERAYATIRMQASKSAQRSVPDCESAVTRFFGPMTQP